ncbi:MAG: YjbQ family protein, partial [Gammaproteobacteria bacterium]|nr:YjbQ family protein [Gammaproteobacteria bacterium]
DGDPAYRHDQEGDDDMAAHIRSVLTQTEITLPVRDGRLALGTWQGLYLWEHRYRAHRRRLTLTLSGL